MPVFTNDQIANQLINNGLTPGGVAIPKFNVAPGGSLAVNITGLTADGQAMVRAALAVWSDATGITFNEVTTGAKITFDDALATTSTSRTTSGGFTTTASVNFASTLVPGTSLDSDAYQIYLREIGRALGLNPAANYDATPDFATERQYDNDSRHNSIMSSFTQADNTILTDSNARVMGPMIADLLAIQSIYGAVNTTRTGNTTYGFNSTAGRTQYDASLYGSVSYVVFDNGGTDTLDYSGFTQNQQISLVAETFSNVGGLVGNVGIARGTVIENAIGGTGADTITGNSANNILNGGGGAASDTLIGAAGNDQYQIITSNDVVVEVAGEGNLDIVLSAVNFALSANADIEQLQTNDVAGTANINLTGSSIGQYVLGNAGGNILLGLAGNDSLYGYGGNDAIDGGADIDYMEGGDGNDTYYVNDVLDTVFESNAAVLTGGSDIVNFSGTSGTYTLTANVERLNLTGSSAINGTGNELANLLFGNISDNILTGLAGADSIDGGAGSDTLIGGDGNDTYYVNVTTDVIIETGSVAVGGSDSVFFNGTSGTYVLSTAVEKLTLTGISNISGTGNSSVNVMIGNSGNNTLSSLAGVDTLDGGAGIDTLIGGDGNDTYYADRIEDVVTETNATVSTGGTDLVYFSGSTGTFTLGTNVENITITGVSAVSATGNASSNVMIGNGAANTLSGLAGTDTIDGGLGADTMIGGDGSDTYYADRADDVVTETNTSLATGGTDRVFFSGTAGTFTLGSNVENITITGAAAVGATGNASNNVMVGNIAANTLSGLGGNDNINGGAGIDTMIGGDGNDTYTADVVADVVTETNADLITGGDDTVIFTGTSGTYLLSANVERLTLSGSSAVNGTGNDSANTILGNAAINTLNGGLGNDTMDGGNGSDIYFADVSTDAISETNAVLSTGGDDLVNFTGSSGTFTLGANIERLTLTGSANTSGTGNELANTILGNTGANTLSGLAGDDTITGGGGLDTMLGGDGSDTYYVDSVDDVVTETNADLLTGGTDTIWYSGASGTTVVLGDNIENLRISGSNTSNLTGNGLDNYLTGGTGVNVLNGMAGNDRIASGAGNDTMTGGTGLDIFLFNSALSFSTNKDTITDFVAADDTIQLENAIFTQLTTTGALSANLFKNLALGSIDADDRIIYDASTGTLSYDADGSAAGVAIAFAVLTGNPTITEADFVVI